MDVYGNCQPKKLWLLNEFSLLISKEMYREQCGEYAYWCLAGKGSVHIYLIIILTLGYPMESLIWEQPRCEQ